MELDHVDPDLGEILNSNKVHDAIKEGLVATNVTDLATFANLCDETSDVGAMLEKTIPPIGDLKNKEACISRVRAAFREASAKFAATLQPKKATSVGPQDPDDGETMDENDRASLTASRAEKRSRELLPEYQGSGKLLAKLRKQRKKQHRRDGRHF